MTVFCPGGFQSGNVALNLVTCCGYHLLMLMLIVLVFVVTLLMLIVLVFVETLLMLIILVFVVTCLCPLFIPNHDHGLCLCDLVVFFS